LRTLLKLQNCDGEQAQHWMHGLLWLLSVAIL